MTDNEVSKIGQSEDEPIEGRIVGEHDGPGGYWHYINEEMKRIVRERIRQQEAAPRDEADYIELVGGWRVPKSQAYEADYFSKVAHAYVSEDGIKWNDIGNVKEFTYERGPSFTQTWMDEMPLSNHTVTMEFEGPIDPELFRLLTGYDLEPKPAVPPVDIDKVKWPGPRAQRRTPRMDWL